MPSDPVTAALELANSVVEAARPVIATWIARGEVDPLEALAKVIPAPEVLAARDAALVEQQRRKAAEVLAPGDERGRHAEAQRREIDDQGDPDDDVSDPRDAW
jgi:hypothetical protein